MSARDSGDVVVVGGGVIGMLSALALAERGRSVTLVDTEEPGRAASWAGGGILSPLPPWAAPGPVAALASESERVYPSLCENLSEGTGHDPEFRRCGIVMLDAEPAADEDAVRAGVAAERLTAESLTERFPGLRSCDGGLLVPGVAQLRNPRLMHALRQRLEQTEGVSIRAPARVRALAARAAGWRVKLADDAMDGAQVLVAAGAWTQRLLEGLGIQTGIEPVRGQMLRYEGVVRGTEPMVLLGDRYLIPRLDGSLVVGSTVERAGYDARCTESGIAGLVAFAESLLPSLVGRAPAQVWAGLRPARQGGVPLIGEVPGYPGLFLCAGHHRLGLTLAPASAGLVTELMVGQTPRLDPEPYRPR